MVLDYSAIAGQLVADGLKTNYPLADFEANGSIAVQKIRALIPKLNTFIRPTEVWGNPLAVLADQRSDQYGSGIELGTFKKAATNKKLDGQLFPFGDAEMVAQIMYDNYGYNFPMTVDDYEVDKVVLNASLAGQYAANKVATVAKGIGQHGYAAYKELLANVVDGNRTITTTENSDGTGSAVTYNKTIVGYAGMVGKLDNVIAPPVRGSPSSIENTDALTVAKTLIAVGEDFKYEGDDFNLLDVETFTFGKPWLLMETKTLTAMDDAFAMNAGYQGFPTMKARPYLADTFKLMEIDKFPNAPTNATYTGYRIGGLILDPRAMIRINRWENVEATRDGPNRRTGYSYRCDALIGMMRDVNSYALFVKASA